MLNQCPWFRITDVEGNPTQFVCYMPFGEAFVDEHTTRTEMPFKFNGKEQDSETGLYYYGARYYDAKICVWYGVDPLAEKGRGWSPYCYAFDNPVRFVDPDGRWPWEASNVRQARLFARQTGGDFQKWKGQDGQRYASVSFGVASKGTGSTTKDSNGNINLAQVSSVSFTFKAGESRSELLQSVGVGFYKSMRASTSGMERLKWIGKSGDAWAAGTSCEYNRNGQAPGLLKAIAGLNPLVSIPNAVSVLAKGEDIYGVQANTTSDKVIAGAEIVSGAVGLGGSVGYLDDLSKGAQKAINIVDNVNTAVQAANDGGLLDEIKRKLDE